MVLLAGPRQCGKTTLAKSLLDRTGDYLNWESSEIARSFESLPGQETPPWWCSILYYLRDKEGREVDFVVTRNRRVHWLIEVKSSDADLSRALRYYADKLKPTESIQLVRNLP